MKLRTGAAIISLIILMIACNNTKERKEELILSSEHSSLKSKVEILKARNNNKSVNGIEAVFGNIEYVKDTRTGLCFAYLQKKYDHGLGIGLSAVPCSAVPDDLLL